VGSVSGFSSWAKAETDATAATNAIKNGLHDFMIAPLFRLKRFEDAHAVQAHNRTVAQVSQLSERGAEKDAALQESGLAE